MERSAEIRLKVKRWAQLISGLTAKRTEDKADVTLICGGKRFPVHRLILETCSPFFAALFSDTLYKRGSCSDQVEFMDLDSSTLAAILDFIYLGEVNKIKSEEELKKVARAARLMMLDDLYKYCCHTLLSFLTTDNFFEIFELNRKADNKNLKLKLLYFWIANGNKLINSNQFLNLALENLKGLFLFLRDNCSRLNVAFVGLSQWLCHNMEAREEFVEELFVCFNAQLLSIDCIKSVAKDASIRNSSPKITNVVNKLVGDWFTARNPDLVAESHVISTRPWATTLTFFSDHCPMSAFDSSEIHYQAFRDKYKCLQRLDLANMTWGPLIRNKMFNNCYSWYDIPMCQYGKFVCMIGRNSCLNGDYDLDTNVFEPVPVIRLSGGMETKLWHFKGRIFSTGYNPRMACSPTVSKRLRNVVYCANPGSNNWKEVQLLQYYRSIAKVIVSSDHMYIIGEVEDTGTIIEYNSDPAQKDSQWGVIHVPTLGLEPHNFLILNNTLHALYFRRGVINLLAYDHCTKTFSIRSKYQTKLNAVKLSLFQNYHSPFVFFSKTDDPFLIPAFMWNHILNTWVVLPPLQGQRCILSSELYKMVYFVDS